MYGCEHKRTSVDGSCLSCGYRSFTPLLKSLSTSPVEAGLEEISPAVLLFAPAVVPAYGTVRMAATVDVGRFRPRVLRIDHRSAHRIDVIEIVAGSRTLLAGSGAVTGESFCERLSEARSLRLNWPVLTAGQQVNLSVHLHPSGPFSGDPRVVAFLVGHERS